MHIELQKLIDQFLNSPFLTVKTSQAPDNLKITALKAMKGQQINDEQRQLLTEFALQRQINLVLNANNFLELPNLKGEDMTTYIHQRIEEEINNIFPPLKIRAANIYLNRPKFLALSNTITPPPPMLLLEQNETNNISSSEESLMQQHFDLMTHYLSDPEYAQGSKTLNLERDSEMLIMAMFTERHKAMKKIQSLLSSTQPQNISYQLDKKGAIDIPRTLRLNLSVVPAPFIKEYLMISIEVGDLVFAQWIWQKTTPDSQLILLMEGDYLLFVTAIKNGHLAVAQWLLEVCPQENRATMLVGQRFQNLQVACDQGHLAIAHWLWELTPDMHRNIAITNNYDFCCGAIAHGHIAVLQWLLQLNTGRIDYCFTSAIYYGKLLIVQWIWDFATTEQRLTMLDSFDCDYNMPFQIAILRRHQPIAEWLWEIASPDERSDMIEDQSGLGKQLQTFALIIDSGYLDTAQWLWQITTPDQQDMMLQQESPYYGNVFQIAVSNDRLDIAQWLWQLYKPKDQRKILLSNEYKTFKRAMELGNNNLTEWLWGLYSRSQQIDLLQHCKDTSVDLSSFTLIPEENSFTGTSSTFFTQQKRVRHSLDSLASDQFDNIERGNEAINTEISGAWFDEEVETYQTPFSQSNKRNRDG